VTIKEAVIQGVASAAILAAGGTLIGLKVNDAKQEERITRLEDLDRSVDGLRQDLQRVDRKLERLDGKLEGEHEPRLR
jgi:hypothetical protein